MDRGRGGVLQATAAARRARASTTSRVRPAAIQAASKILDTYYRYTTTLHNTQQSTYEYAINTNQRYILNKTLQNTYRYAIYTTMVLNTKHKSSTHAKSNTTKYFTEYLSICN